MPYQQNVYHIWCGHHVHQHGERVDIVAFRRYKEGGKLPAPASREECFDLKESVRRCHDCSAAPSARHGTHTHSQETSSDAIESASESDNDDDNNEDDDDDDDRIVNENGHETQAGYGSICTQLSTESSDKGNPKGLWVLCRDACQLIVLLTKRDGFRRDQYFELWEEMEDVRVDLKSQLEEQAQALSDMIRARRKLSRLCRKKSSN